MESNRFDSIARSLAATADRRSVAKGAAGLALGALAVTGIASRAPEVDAAEVEAEGQKKKNCKDRCKKNCDQNKNTCRDRCDRKCKNRN